MATNVRIAIVGLVVLMLAGCGGSTVETASLLQPLSGGQTTVQNATKQAFSRPAANINSTQRAEFAMGNAFFNSPWIVAPATAGARDGLGPFFNARSCDACHNNDGRGRPPERARERPIALVFQLGLNQKGPHGEPVPDPNYGGNLNPFSTFNELAEGTVDIRYEEHPGKFADGEPYSLRVPTYEFNDLQYGDLHADARFSPRIAPAVFGVGLLEAIPESQILAQEDPDDRDGDGISGRANRVWDRTLERAVVGRFGWKANQPDIAHQTAAAFSGEIGMSSTLFPDQNCGPAVKDCIEAPHGGEPEVSDEIFAHVVSYQRMLAVPARRGLDQKDVQAGAALFVNAGCAACHTPTFTTGKHPKAPWLSEQIIHPFTDLLLHDMGPALADDRDDYLASGVEWRTPPLWGLGLQHVVNGHTYLLHDGRARDVKEAILWHGGEAEKSKEAFRTMSRKDRAALLAFVDSL